MDDTVYIEYRKIYTDSLDYIKQVTSKFAASVYFSNILTNNQNDMMFRMLRSEKACEMIKEVQDCSIKYKGGLLGYIDRIISEQYSFYSYITQNIVFPLDKTKQLYNTQRSDNQAKEEYTIQQMLETFQIIVQRIVDYFIDEVQINYIIFISLGGVSYCIFMISFMGYWYNKLLNELIMIVYGFNTIPIIKLHDNVLASQIKRVINEF